MHLCLTIRIYMKKAYFLIAISIIATTITIHAMDPVMDPNNTRNPLVKLIDTFIGSTANEISSNWHGIFTTLDKLSSGGFTPFTVNEYLSPEGHTLLCHAIQDNDFLAAKILLEKYGANPNGKTLTGMTPLMFACKDGYVDMVVLLLQHGANPLIQNINGKDSFFFAATYAKYNIMQDDTVLRILKTYRR